MPSFSGSKPIFQTYILAAIPFRRRHSSNASALTSFSDESTEPTSPAADTLPSAVEPSPSFLNTTPRSTISCSKCHAELALTSQIISKGFTGRHGRAYLVSQTDPIAVAPSSPKSPHATSSSAAQTGAPVNDDPLAAHPSHPNSFTTALPNTYTGRPVPRNLVTGLHTVCDVSCSVCSSNLGWKYVGAEDDSQRYKVGKFILESRRTTVQQCWEERGNDDDDQLGGCKATGSNEICFDSADEDECDDLFSGHWSPAIARRRRAPRLAVRA